ncbi:MAG TPA: hypothetical protein PLO99_03530 [Chitinophagaceae bacterium]|jgi:O-antigen ligase|nr:hypothetical protein [Chitinophagaceae bacterium]
MKKESGIYGFILLAVLLGWLLLEWMKKKIQPRRSARQALLFLAGVLLFLFVYTAAIIFAVRMIFGKPS